MIQKDDVHLTGHEHVLMVVVLDRLPTARSTKGEGGTVEAVVTVSLELSLAGVTGSVVLWGERVAGRGGLGLGEDGDLTAVSPVVVPLVTPIA